MWAKVLDILNQRLESVPRHRVLYALMKLRDAMRCCHSNYLAILEVDPDFKKRFADSSTGRKVLEATSPSPEADNRVSVWGESVNRLHLALREVSVALEVYNGDLHFIIANYVDQEIGAFHPIYGSTTVDTECLEAVQNPEFDEIATKLDTFLSDRFSLEEIHAASRRLS